MSTILDALRKVEEETRTQNADARTRLLSATQRFDFRTPRRQRIPWGWVAGCILVGIAIGVGGLLFGSRESIPPQVALVETPEAPAPEMEAVSPERTHSQARRPPTESALPAQQTPPVPAGESQPYGVPAGASYSAWGARARQDLHTYVPPPQPPPSEALVQKSPFVAAPPPEQTAVPPAEQGSRPQLVQSDRRRTMAAKPVAPQPSAAESSEPNSVVDVGTIEELPLSEPTAEEGSPAPPDTSLTFLQWSSEPNKRIASIKVGNGPSTLAHEGDSIGDMTVVKIRPDAVELQSGSSHYTLKVQ